MNPVPNQKSLDALADHLMMIQKILIVIQKDNLQELDIILDKIPKNQTIGVMVLHFAAAAGAAHIINAMVERGIPVDARWKKNYTPLHTAVGGTKPFTASTRSLAAIQTLVKLGTDPNAIDEHGNTPLHLAAQAGHEILVKALLDAGVRIDTINTAGYLAVDVATGEARPILQAYTDRAKLGVNCVTGEQKNPPGTWKIL